MPRSSEDDSVYLLHLCLQGPSLPLEEQDGAVLASRALSVYAAAFEEFQHAMAVESRDRAELLAAMWHQFFSLLEIRAAATMELQLTAARHNIDTAEAAVAASAASVARVEERLQEVEREHVREIELRDAQLKTVAQVCAACAPSLLDQHEDPLCPNCDQWCTAAPKSAGPDLCAAVHFSRFSTSISVCRTLRKSHLCSHGELRRWCGSRRQTRAGAATT
jgi:rubrerythrin